MDVVALAGTGGEASIDLALSEYQSSQQNEYETYWTYQNELVNGEVVLPTSDISYYTSVYQAEALTKYAATDTTDINNFVNTSISTLELAATQQYYSLAAIYGPGGTYAQSVASGASNFDGATNSQVTASTSSAETLAADIIYGTLTNSGHLPSRLAEAGRASVTRPARASTSTRRPIRTAMARPSAPTRQIHTTQSERSSGTS